jgi:hypothetical protein
LAEIQFPALHQIFAQGPQNAVQHPRALPLLKTAMTSLIGPVTARQILPRRTGAQNPQHTVQNMPSLAPSSPTTIRPPSLLLIPLHKIPHVFPLKITQISHTSGLPQLPPERKRLFL